MAVRKAQLRLRGRGQRQRGAASQTRLVYLDRRHVLNNQRKQDYLQDTVRDTSGSELGVEDEEDEEDEDGDDADGQKFLLFRSVACGV